MEFIIKFNIFLLIFFINFSLYSIQTYESYLDILEEKVNVENKDWKINVLFSRVEFIYLVFYDKKRKEILIQFKNDIYDYKNDTLKKNFLSGQPYTIYCEFKGILKGVDFISANSLQKEDFFNNKENISICFLKQFIPLALDEVFF